MNTLILTPEAMFQGDLLLVNPSFPHHPLPHPDLVTVADTDILLERRAAQALDSLMAAIGGWKEIVPVSGWRALEEQVAAPEVIDAALRDGGGFPMGPLALTDLIGQDVNFAVTCSVFNAFWQDRRYLPSLLQQELALAGRLGKKSGHGVYRWPAETLPDAGKAAAPSGGGLICFGRADRLHRL